MSGRDKFPVSSGAMGRLMNKIKRSVSEAVSSIIDNNCVHYYFNNNGPATIDFEFVFYLC